jgi:hypothetical protein
MSNHFPPPFHRSLAQRLRALFFTGLVVFAAMAEAAKLAKPQMETQA